MSIIVKNPFRILGVKGNVTERELQKQISIIKRFDEVGKTKSFEFDFDFLGDFTRRTHEIQEASNKIEQAQKKLIYSLFWFVKNNKYDEIAFNNLIENKTEKAIEIWEKTLKDQISSKNYSSYLNLSTLLIALSTFDKQIELQKLQKGILLKGNLIQSENLLDFSKLVTGNGITNDPIEISKKFVDEVIELLKPYLNKKNGISTNDLISLFNTFPASIKKYISAKFTEIPISSIENKIEKTTRKRKDNPRDAEEHGEELYKSTKTDITSLKKLKGASNMQFQMLSDKVANEILQCSVDFFNERQENDSDDNFEINLNKAIGLVKLAKSVAVTNQVKDRAEENINTLLEMKDREISQAIDILQSVKDAYKTNEAKIFQQVRVQKASLGYGQSINWTKVDELIKNSLDWDKVVELILNVIPSKNIDRIKSINDASKLKRFKELVEFIIEKMSYSNKNRVKYLCYWKTANKPTRKSTKSHTSSSSSSSSSGCYIATMAYGDYDHPQVMILRKFRDETLSNTFFGRNFINFYYATSPHLVKLLKNQKYINQLIRNLLDRFVNKVK